MGINMLHQTPNGLPETGNFRPRSWLDVVGLVITLVGVGPGGRSDGIDDGPVKQVSGETSSRRRGRHGALANKRAFVSRARGLGPIIREVHRDTSLTLCGAATMRYKFSHYHCALVAAQPRPGLA
jgi:hypothetical protein